MDGHIGLVNPGAYAAAYSIDIPLRWPCRIAYAFRSVAGIARARIYWTGFFSLYFSDSAVPHACTLSLQLECGASPFHSSLMHLIIRFACVLCAIFVQVAHPLEHIQHHCRISDYRIRALATMSGQALMSDSDLPGVRKLLQIGSECLDILDCSTSV
jgi:hypothetical protein